MGKFSNKFLEQLTDLKADMETKIGVLAMKNTAVTKKMGLKAESGKVMDKDGEHILTKPAEYLVGLLEQVEDAIAQNG